MGYAVRHTPFFLCTMLKSIGTIIPCRFNPTWCQSGTNMSLSPYNGCTMGE